MHLTNVKEKNVYILKTMVLPSWTKKPDFLLYNAKPKNKLSEIADINYGQ